MALFGRADDRRSGAESQAGDSETDTRDMDQDSFVRFHSFFLFVWFLLGCVCFCNASCVNLLNKGVSFNRNCSVAWVG